MINGRRPKLRTRLSLRAKANRAWKILRRQAETEGVLPGLWCKMTPGARKERLDKQRALC